MLSPSMPNFTPQALYAVVHLIATRMGSAEGEASEVADHLVRANLAGHDSHGVGMMPAYVQLLHEKLLVLNQTPDTILDFGALLVIDARRGYGQRMAAEAMRRATVRAKETGACVLALRNAAHIGRIGTYGELAAGASCAFIAFVNVTDHRDIAAPFGCAEPRLGTNPFCVALPGQDGSAVLLDMATTTIAAGKARVAFNKGVSVPDGALMNAAGNIVTDPTDFIREHAGALLTFGQHKGSGLAVICELLAGAVGGGRGVDEPYHGGILNSMLAIVIDLTRLGDVDLMADRAAHVKAHIRSSRLAPGHEEILLPGEPERRSAEKRRREGIPVDETTWHDICTAAGTLGVTEAEIAQVVGANRVIEG